MTFAKGAALKDPSRRFNSSLEAISAAQSTSEGEKVDEAALQDLIHTAVALNRKSKGRSKPGRARRKKAK